MMYESACACKGIRTCNICNPNATESLLETSSSKIYIYCDSCRQAVRMSIYEANAQCPHHDDIGNRDIAFPLDGIYLVSDFVTEQEEQDLVNLIDNDIWISSQSGRLKQDFGIKINFKKQTIKTKYFTGMPIYSRTILERIQTHRLLKDFQSVELCHLDYRQSRGSHIDPHIDDTWIWGERLITINLLSNTILTLIPNENQSNKIIYIPLPRRWLIVLYSDARYEYKHAIQKQHIHDRRLAVTFRELTSKSEKFYEENQDLYERILRISQRFTGISVGRFEQISKEIQALNIEPMEIDQQEFQQKFSQYEKLNSTTYSSSSSNELIKLFPQTFPSIKTIYPSVDIFNNEYFLMTWSNLSKKQLGSLLAQWRLTLDKQAYSNPLTIDWFNREYASIINKKKPSFPFLLSNLYTCQEQLSGALIDDNHQFDCGYSWRENQLDFFIRDLIWICSKYFDDLKEIVQGYDEICKLTTNEINYFDTFLRLQLILNINSQDIDDDKSLDTLELLSSKIFFVKNLFHSN